MKKNNIVVKENGEKVFSMIRELLKDENSKEKYFVDDLISKNTKIMFLLESPHTNEIKCKYPLVGSSGRAMTKFIFKVLNNKNLPIIGDKIVPFGKLINDVTKEKNKHHYLGISSETIDSLKKIGIMNVCNIPMQMSAYCCDDIIKHCSVLKALDFKRTSPVNKKRKGKNKKHREAVDKVLCFCFSKKIANKSNQIYYVPLGKVALTFLQSYNSKSNKKLNFYGANKEKAVPHPSPRNTEWNNIDEMNLKNAQTELEKLGCEIIKKLEIKDKQKCKTS